MATPTTEDKKLQETEKRVCQNVQNLIGELKSIAPNDKRVTYLHREGAVNSVGECFGNCFGGDNWGSLIRLGKTTDGTNDGMLHHHKPTSEDPYKFEVEIIDPDVIPEQLQGLVDSEEWKKFVTDSQEASFIPAPCRAGGFFVWCCCIDTCLCHQAKSKEKMQQLVDNHKEPMKQRGIGLEYFDKSHGKCIFPSAIYVHKYGIFMNIEGEPASAAGGAPVAQKMEQE